MIIDNYETWLFNLCIEKLKIAFNNCPPEIVFCRKVKILVPKYFYNFLTTENDFLFSGHKLEIGYEHAIVIFDENNTIKGRIYKYLL
jgi:hypothetical protein